MSNKCTISDCIFHGFENEGCNFNDNSKLVNRAVLHEALMTAINKGCQNKEILDFCKLNALQKMELINKLLKELKESGTRIYDDNDPDWYLDEIVYKQREDELYFCCEEKNRGKE